MYIYKLIYTYKAQLDENPEKRPLQGSGTHGGGRQVTGTVKLRNSLKNHTKTTNLLILKHGRNSGSPRVLYRVLNTQ